MCSILTFVFVCEKTSMLVKNYTIVFEARGAINYMHLTHTLKRDLRSFFFLRELKTCEFNIYMHRSQTLALKLSHQNIAHHHLGNLVDKYS